MPKKQVLRVSDSAVCLRPETVSGCTLLFDESNLAEFNQADTDWFDVCFTQSPEKPNEQLQQWAGNGRWLAIQSHPVMLDDDGIPGLDLVILNSENLTELDAAISNGPNEDAWFDPVSQYFDLTTGKLRVVYNDDFFLEGTDQNEDLKQVDKYDDAIPTEGNFAESLSYLITCEPGFYRAHIFTRFIDEMSEYEPEPGSPDLVIYLEPTEKPLEYPKSPALLPIHPETQDMKAVLLRAQKVAKQKGWS